MARAFIFSVCILISFQSSLKKSIKLGTMEDVVLARLLFLFCCALTTGRCNPFQHNFVN